MVISVLSIIWPARIGYGVWIAVMSACGLWNLYLTADKEMLGAGILGGLQLWWAFRLYLEARTVNQQFPRAEAEIAGLYNDLMRQVKRVDRADADPAFFRLK